VLARPLASVYAANGNPLPDLRELGKARSAAIVMVSCEVPEGGGRYGDTFDIFVQASHSAKSLRGGTLILSPLMNADPLNPRVFAMAQGPIVLEDTETPTSGRIRAGAQLIRDIRPPAVGVGGSGVFNLVLRPHFRSFAVARTLAAEINGITADLETEQEASEPVAQAIDDSTIRVVIPDHERANPTNFLASIMSKRFSPSLIDLPAMVVVNERTGSIVITGDVEISAVTVGSDRLIITTTTPTPVPTPSNPLVTQQNWTEFGSTATGGERARIQDLLEAFKQLNVPVREQIQILAQIDRAGRLNARFVRE
jgi:flagellar P-ring protein precursor FlgI